MRLMSASIRGDRGVTATRAALKPRIAAERPATPSLALRAWSMNAVAAREAVGSRTQPPSLGSDFPRSLAGRPASCAR